jgi:hypothetical protein
MTESEFQSIKQEIESTVGHLGFVVHREGGVIEATVKHPIAGDMDSDVIFYSSRDNRGWSSCRRGRGDHCEDWMTALLEGLEDASDGRPPYSDADQFTARCLHKALLAIKQP